MDLEKYLGLFVSEAREHVEAAGRQISLLSRGISAPESLNALFRHFHSIKGMAASMGFSEIGALSHAGEDLLDRARKGEIAIDAGIAEALMESVDRLSAMIEERGRRETPREDPADPHVARLRGILDAHPGPPAPDLSGFAVPLSAGVRTVRVLVQIDRASELPGARAALARRRLEGAGRIVAADPPEERWLARGFDGRVVLTLQTGLDDGAILARLEGLVDLRRAELLAPAAEPDPAQPTSPAADPAGSEEASTIRIPTAALDRFLDSMAELLTRRGTVSESLRGRDLAGASAALSKLSESIDLLRGEVMGLRLLPFEHIVPRLEMIVRDLCRRIERRAALEVEGAEVALDRSVLQELIDPLGHLLRNAVDHGLEPPGERAAAGKPPAGVIRIEVKRIGERVDIAVADDGRGMDIDSIRRAAIAGGFATEGELAAMDPDRTLMLTTIPGFSTAGRVTDISGRGVGLDVVRTRIESLRGQMRISTTPGRGSRISLNLPLTVVLIDAFLVEADGTVFAVPAAGVASVHLLDSRKIRRSVSGSFFEEEVDDGSSFIPVIALEEIAGAAKGPPADRAGRPVPALLCQVDSGRAALVVSRIRDRRDLVVQPLGAPLDRLRKYAGAALLDDGTVALILDVASLARSAR